MAIAYQSSTTASDPGNSISSLTFSHTVSTGNNRMLLVAISAEVGVSSVTFNGISLTQIHSVSYGNENSVWYLAAPPATTANIVVNFGATGNLYPTIIAANFTDVKQTSFYRTVAKSQGASSTSCTVSPTSQVGDLVVDFNGNRSVGGGVFNPTVGSGGTDRAYVAAGIITGISLATEPGAAGTTTMDWTWSGNQYYAQISFALIEDTSTGSNPQRVYKANQAVNRAGTY